MSTEEETTPELAAHERPEEAKVKFGESKRIIDGLGVGCRTVFATGHPAGAILEESAKGSDQIIGNPGAGFVEGLLLGSTTDPIGASREDTSDDSALRSNQIAWMLYQIRY